MLKLSAFLLLKKSKKIIISSMNNKLIHRSENIINAYLAKKVIGDIIYGNCTEADEFYVLLNTNTTVKFLRKELTNDKYSNSLKQLANIISSEDTRFVVKELCISMCKEVISDSDIKDALFRLYDSKRISYSLIYTLLEYSNLDIDIHRYCFCYIKDNWSSFMNESKHSKNAIDIIEQRIERTSVPITKHWIYWCTILHSNDREEVAYFLNNLNKDETYGLNNDMILFRKEVINFLKEKFKQ